jgi:uncharacterized protein YukE
MGADVPSRPEVALRVAEADTAIQRELAALMERIAPLTQCCEETAASFRVLRSRWQEDASQLHAALADIATAVGGSR